MGSPFHEFLNDVTADGASDIYYPSLRGARARSEVFHLSGGEATVTVTLQGRMGSEYGWITIIEYADAAAADVAIEVTLMPEMRVLVADYSTGGNLFAGITKGYPS
jgi:hypothetical protein